ncbi:MAG: pyridoxine 5'-phosphate synthase [Planctomycetes bacterium GWA2_40_7]|nr:MAG: pyridoxine 5'-phosphate synthase [Planctomycetes bacterium GWA2_40_7]OHB46652.1 MAG: pyridoxine 5'-phosphate synthase [Planctomycetes bacterium GWF2_40_8]OHB90316.1 MAG: pyridoxine 5'-phosphate synthase [Planctomycetes bacterium RIFCSPHIGHO2_02_FULL_40_12]OHC04826.1 MAG: pyridoxine 5'-phosphate synthase [Planctomycetes bacterium RIFCSPLOWO2_12_FULL_40_19]
MIKLGVNVDHVATLRQARLTYEPDPVTATGLAELGGADIITVHLREDRRHIQDRDLDLLRQTVFTKLNLEMATSQEIIDIAIKVKPEQVTLVPEKRQEVTTEGGLSVTSQKKLLTDIIKRFKDNDIYVSLFIDPDKDQIIASGAVGAQSIELHTGNYANAKSEKETAETLKILQEGVKIAQDAGLRVNAGHGLTYKNTGPIVEVLDVEELHIGHSIVSRAIFVGLKRAVKEMKDLIYKHYLIKQNF